MSFFKTKEELEQKKREDIEFDRKGEEWEDKCNFCCEGFCAIMHFNECDFENCIFMKMLNKD